MDAKWVVQLTESEAFFPHVWNYVNEEVNSIISVWKRLRRRTKGVKVFVDKRV